MEMERHTRFSNEYRHRRIYYHKINQHKLLNFILPKVEMLVLSPFGILPRKQLLNCHTQREILVLLDL